MNRRIIWRDLMRNRAVWFAMVLFIAAASALLSLAAILAVNLSGTIERLMLDAKTPHFMQMHSGELDISRLEAFAGADSNVADWQVTDFLNVDNAQIILGGNSLADSVQDNGFCIQSRRFDFLLDSDSRPVYPKNGQLYVPVCYFKEGIVKTGDDVTVGGMHFTVAGFIRDSQMNSALASSKRFVVSPEDFSQLRPLGNVEYLIEFRLADSSELGAFETAYSAAGLPANGPALTWPLFQMISAVSDGIMIAVIVLIGILVILVALLCVRFTLLTKIEDDYREIGVMKAVGMRVSDIRRIYLAIYAAIAAVGSILGFLLSLMAQVPMKESIRLNLGGSKSSVPALVLGAAGALAVCAVILLYVNGSLRHFRKISPAQAIRFGAGTDAAYKAGRLRLSDNRFLSANFFLGLKDVLARKRLYSTMLVVIVLASFIMIVPQNLYHTISGEDFVAYLGVGKCDLRLDIQQTSQMDEKTLDIGNYMENDSDITSCALFTSKIFPVRLEDGTTENMKVELGDHTVFPLKYAAGRMPVREDEIALSAMNAQELQKDVGSRITLMTSDGEKRLTVCGIYSDITNGGKTAKAVFTDDAADAAWTVVCAGLADKNKLDDKISEYGAQFPYAKISSIEAYMAQTFGQTLQAVRTASFTAVLVSAAITLLITLLFMKMLAAKDRYSIAVLRAVGFTEADIRRQYAWRAVLVLAVGICLGTVLAGTLGEQLSAAVIASFGAAAFRFTVNPLSTYLLSPLIMLSAAIIATILGTCRAGDVELCEAMKE